MAERFEGTLERHGSGTLLEVPFDVRATFGKARAPVRGTVNGHPFRTTVATYGGRYFLGFRREIREATACRTPTAASTSNGSPARSA